MSSDDQLRRQGEFAFAHFSKVAHQCRLVRCGHLASLVGQAAETIDQLLFPALVAPILLGGSRQELLAHFVQLGFHLLVTRKVETSELLDEMDQPVQGFLMNSGFRSVNACQHVCAKLGGLGAKSRDAVADE